MSICNLGLYFGLGLQRDNYTVIEVFGICLCEVTSSEQEACLALPPEPLAYEAVIPRSCLNLVYYVDFSIAYKCLCNSSKSALISSTVLVLLVMYVQVPR